MKKTSEPDPRKSKPKKGAYRPVHPANSRDLHLRRMRRARDEPGAPLWMDFASGYDRFFFER